MDVSYASNTLKSFGMYGKTKMTFSVLLTYVTLFLFFSFNTLMVVRLLLNNYTILMSTFIFYLVIIAFNVLFRFYFFALNNGFSSLVEDMNVTPRSVSVNFDVLETEMRIKSNQKLRKFCRMCYVFGAVCNLVFVSSPQLLSLTYDQRCRVDVEGMRLYLDQWHPLLYEIWLPGTDAHEKPLYPYIYVLQCSAFTIQLIIDVVTYAFLCSLMLAVSERGAFLARLAPRALRPGRKGHVTLMGRAWIRYHQHYLGIIRRINKELGPFVLLIQVYGVTKLMFNVFFGLVAGEMMIALAASDVCPLILNLLAFSVVGQKIINSSEQLARSTVSVMEITRGGLKPGPTLSALQVVRARCAMGDGKITGLRLFTVHIGFFAKVFSAAMSYILVLIQVQHHK